MPTRNTGHQRAQRMYREMGLCEVCGLVPATERHHKDEDTLNNARDNVVFACRRCHMTLDGRLEAVRQQMAARPKRTPKVGKCINPICGIETNRLRLGRCPICYLFFRRTGKDRTTMRPWSADAKARNRREAK